MRVCGPQRSGKRRERSGKRRERSAKRRVKGRFLLFWNCCFFGLRSRERSGKRRAKVWWKTSKGLVKDEQRSGERRVAKYFCMNNIYNFCINIIYIFPWFYRWNSNMSERSGKRRAKIDRMTSAFLKKTTRFCSITMVIFRIPRSPNPSFCD